MAFVHLHNHSCFSILDAATRIPDMVKRAVEFEMPAVALTDHGYMFGIPELDLECRKYNDDQKNMKQWRHDVECFQKGWELEEPEADPEGASYFDAVHAQWESDCKVWEESAHDLEAVRANRPRLKVKPIFGCEAYFITDDCIERGTPQRRYHLILLAKNETGYVNLIKCMSKAAGHEMMYYKPRTTLDMLKEYHEGLICQSACVQGIIQQRILDGQFDEAREWAQTFKDIFGDDFYMEIQDHGLNFRNGFDDRSLDEKLVNLAHELDIKVIATNDFHYLTREDAPTQDILSCIGKATTLDDPNRMRMEGTEFYMKSEQEMRELFSWCPEACDNTLEVAEKCDYELDWDSMFLPEFPGLREGETADQRFREECEKGLARRYGDDWRNVTISGINVEERYEHGNSCHGHCESHFQLSILLGAPRVVVERIGVAQCFCIDFLLQRVGEQFVLFKLVHSLMGTSFLQEHLSQPFVSHLAVDYCPTLIDQGIAVVTRRVELGGMAIEVGCHKAQTSVVGLGLQGGHEQSSGLVVAGVPEVVASQLTAHVEQ